MDRTRKYPERGIPEPKGHAWYVLTDRWILAKKYRIPMIIPIVLKKFNKKDGFNKGVSIPLTRRNKIITGGTGMEGHG